AYLGKLMAELHVNNPDNLKDVKDSFASNNNCIKVCRYDKELNEKLNADIQFINKRNKEEQLNSLYDQACTAMNKAESEKAFLTIASLFDRIPEYKDSKSLADKCRELAEICRKDGIYEDAKKAMARNTIDSYEDAIKTLNYIPGWKDSDEQASLCREKIDEIKRAEEEARLEAQRKAEQQSIQAEKAAKKRKRIIAVITPVVVACIAFIVVLITVIIPKQKLNKANELLASGDYEAAYTLLEEIGNNDAIASSKYDRALALIDSGDYEAAYTLLEEIGNNDAIASSKYDRAVALIDSGDYDTAIELLKKLNYKDSEAQLVTCYIGKYGEKEYNLIKSINVGDTYKFGSYEQDNNTSNGKEDIEWIVLKKEGLSLMLISKYTLDCQQYNTEYKNVTWETCSLRTWLNGTFINNAFSSNEQKIIRSTKVTADKNPSYSTNPGNDTNDKVFLLSINEVNEYFSSDAERECKPTEYAVAQGAFKSDSSGNCVWWLRSPGLVSDFAADVYGDGSVGDIGDNVDRDDCAVRPALWIDL
ncbi:MAG: DUF6273 domain-containing protein, partial [Clostridiales bacterium]|nr:DUF6273 domain-containing protein [Clostridiales bacterium]